MFGRQITVDSKTKIVRLGGRPPRVTMVLLVVQLGIFLLFAFSDGPKWMAEHLALSTGKALGLFEVWQPFTAVWLHLGIRSLVLDLAALWLFGSALERWWGGKRFLVFFVITAMAGLLAGMLAGLAQPTALMSGSQGAAVAMLVATAYIFPAHLAHLQALLPLKARALALVLGGFVLLGSVISALWFDLVIQLGGAAAALVFLGPRQMVQKWRVARMKKKLHVVEGGRKDGGPYLN